MSESSWIILAAIYVVITSIAVFVAWWLRDTDDDDNPDLRPSRWIYVAAFFWPLFVLVAAVT